MGNNRRHTIISYSYLIALVIAILSLFSTPSLAQQRRIDPEIQKQIDDFVQFIYLPSTNTTSLGLSIVQDDGELLYSTGYGLANIEKGIPYGNTTQVMLGSVSKSFTAVLAIKHLHEKFPHLGESVLDTPISQLLPQINFTLIDRFRSEHATFRDYLGHRICLFDQPLMADPFDTMDEMAYRMRYNEEVCGIRGNFSYANQNFVMVGWLTGILANKSYENAMQDLWDELGLFNTTFVKRTDNYTEMPYRALPYYIKDGEIHPMNTELLKRVITSNPSGGVYSTPSDMLKYMRFHSNHGSLDGKEIVPREVMEWLMKPSNMLTDGYFSFKKSDEDRPVHQFGYGLAFTLSSYDGWEYNQHGGYYPPYHNLMSFFPATNLAMYANSHMSPDESHPVVLHAFIFELLRGHGNATEKALKLMQHMKVKQEEEAKKAKRESQKLYHGLVEKALSLNNPVITVGKYGNGHAGELELSERFNEETNRTQYYIDYGRWYQGWLDLFVGDSLFKITYVTDVVHEDYAVGASDNNYALIQDDTLTLFGTLGLVGTFRLGLELDMLPVVPWDPRSC